MSPTTAGGSNPVGRADWADKTVVVTGGLGFVGSHFVDELLAAGANVVCVHRTAKPTILAELPRTNRLRLLQIDLLDYEELAAAVRYVAPAVDAIVHCAALDGNLEFKLSNSARILDTNLRINSNVLNCARRYEVPDVVLISSAEVYSAPSANPITEDEDYRRHMAYSNNGYSLSKTFAEVLAELYRAQFDMNIFVARPTNVYGPRDGVGSPVNRVIPSMVRRIANGEEIEIWGDGRQVRSFVFARDLVRSTLDMVVANEHHTFNVGTREEISIIDLARLVAATLEQPERIRLLPDKPAGAASRTLDVSRIYDTVDFKPVPLREGLRETVRWFRNNAQLHPAA